MEKVGKIEELEKKAFRFRQLIMDVCYRNQCGHPSSALSCIDILTVLYYGNILKYDIKDINMPNRDRFIMSKGHACIGLYVILYDLGIISYQDLYSYCQKGSFLGGHINRLLVPGTEFSAGSLGHGLSYAIGQALNLKYKNCKNHVYVMLGDGECEEGSVWEGIMVAKKYKLDNLTVIVDSNKLQGSDFTSNITVLDPADNKWASFGWDVVSINGHDISEVIETLKRDNLIETPRVIIANTIKGKGVSLMEGKNHWHSRRPNDTEWNQVKNELMI